MKKLVRLTVLALAAAGIMNCATARVLKETESTAVIQGVGATEFEAKDNAEKKAIEILGAVKETQKAECNQEFRSSGSTSGTGADQQYKQSGGTYYSCVLYFAKK